MTRSNCSSRSRHRYSDSETDQRTDDLSDANRSQPPTRVALGFFQMRYRNATTLLLAANITPIPKQKNASLNAAKLPVKPEVW
jgi:hypothetical protein